MKKTLTAPAQFHPRDRRRGRQLAHFFIRLPGGFAAWLGVFWLGVAATVGLTRGPYVQSVEATSAIVVWRTSAPATGQLDYGVGDYAFSIELADPTIAHVATLTDLRPDTEVQYRILADGVELANGAFRTAASPGRPFTFAVLGDSGTGSPEQLALAERLVRLDPQFVLHTGDVVYPDGQASGYDPFFFRPYQALAQRAPIFPALGNHDYRTQRAQPYLDAFYLPHNNPSDTERYYSFDWGNAHFVALDFNSGPDSLQLDWLKQDLAATPQPWKFVFYHQAIYSSGPHGYEDWVEAKRRLLAPIFEEYGVDVVFNGHDHDYERTLPINGVVYIVSGGGGGPLYQVKPQPFSAYADSTYHTVFATLDGCTLRLQAIQPDGTVFDSTTLEKTCTAATPEPTAIPAASFTLQRPLFLPVVWRKN